jgi:S1-C subfamily serine protease
MATKIVVEHLFGSRLGQRQEFDPRPRLRFGRHPDNEVAFDAHKDLDASTRHAELREEQGRWLLLDVGSSNGTLIAGQKIARQEVTPGKPVEIEFGAGGPRVRLYIGDPAQLVVPATMVGRARSHAGGASDLAFASTVSAGEGGVAAAAAARGRRTVSMMVQSALADTQDTSGLARSTRFVRSFVDQALHMSTQRFRITMLLLATLGLGVLVALVIWNVSLSRGAERSSAAPAAGEAGPRIVHQNRDALYLLGFVDKDGTQTAFCTSFAVSPRYLATNSHCVDRVNELRASKLEVFAVQNGKADARVHVTSVMQHPEYRAAAPHQTKDVALVEVDTPLPAVVHLATRAQLEAIEPGVSMYTYGFPGRLAKPSEPEATLTSGTIGRVTTLDEKVGSFEDNVLLQHSAFTMEGTSGSPVFDAAGNVIAVNTGSYVREKDLRLYDPDSKEIKDRVAVAEPLSGYNVAIRSDMVGELMRAKGVP